jgi:hypothetical protein
MLGLLDLFSPSLLRSHGAQPGFFLQRGNLIIPGTHASHLLQALIAGLATSKGA